MASDTDNSGSPAGSNRSSPARYDCEILCFYLLTLPISWSECFVSVCLFVCLFVPLKQSVYKDGGRKGEDFQLLFCLGV